MVRQIQFQVFPLFFICSHRFFPRAVVKVLLAFVFTLLVGGCAYFNYYYNAQKYYRQAEKQEREAQKEGKTFSGRSSLYEKAIESAGKLLLYYPESRWEDDALLLIAKAYFKTAKYRSAITKIEELEAKYPQSSLIAEGQLVKGLSFFKVAEPDSGIMLLQKLINTRSDPQILYLSYQALGDHYLKEKNFDQAWECYRKAGEFAPRKEDKVTTMLQEGMTLTLLGRHREAVELYDKILKERLSPGLRYQAALSKGRSLLMAGLVEEAQVLIEGLYILAVQPQQQSQLDLEIARCLIARGWVEEAVRKLKTLTENEKRGAIAAEAYYLLGELIWKRGKDALGAKNALSAVKAADRTSEYAARADSLLREVEVLGRKWSRLAFLERGLQMVDSAISGLRSLTAKETLWVDSLKMGDALSFTGTSRPTQGKGRSSKSGGKEDVAGGSPGAEVILDSLTLRSLDSLWKNQRLNLRMELAESYWWDFNQPDSAQFYLAQVLDEASPPLLRAKAWGLMAYIAESKGELEKRDSLYRLILNSPPDKTWQREIEKRLGISSAPVSVLSGLLSEAESLWAAHDWVGARQIYLLAASQADSFDIRGAQALLAAAYISQKYLGEDEVRAQIEKELKGRYPRSPHSRHISLGEKKTSSPSELLSGLSTPPRDEEETLVSRPLNEPPNLGMAEVIYTPDQVDDPPTLLTPPEALKNYLESYYPFEMISQNVIGKVEMELTLDPMGKVIRWEVLNADPTNMGFEEAAGKIVPFLEYSPARKGGKWVAVRVRQRLEFKPPY